MATTAERTDHSIQWLTTEEAREAFDARAREWFGISGEEFIRRWDAGEFAATADDADHPQVMWLATLIPFGR